MKGLNPLKFAGWIILIHLIVATFYGVTASTRPKQPHIIVIMADDLGWNDVSYHGSNQIPTPNIDALAYNGVILKNYYAQPVCTPSRGSFLTGQYAIRTGLQGAPLSAGESVALPLNFTLLPEHLRNLGYATNLIGKWHVGYYAKEFLPTFRGFDHFYGYYNGYIKYFSYILENISNHFPGYDLHHDTDKNLTVDWTPKKVYATDLFTNEAENVIGNHDPKIPLYLQFSHLAPHTSGFAGDLEVRNISQVNETFHYVTNDRRRLYAGMVSALDESTGRVVEALEKKGMLSDSVIIFVSDNGAMTRGSQPNEGSNFPYRGQKFSLYEGGVHVPALVWSPIIRNTSRIHKHYFHVTDWLPTLYKLAGGNIDDLGPIDGIDQSDSIIYNSPSPRDAILLNIDEVKNTSGAIKGPFKYVAGVPIADGFYMGENVDDGDSSAPPYNFTSVMKSVASLAISNINNDSALSEDKILQLRRASKIVCARQTDQPPLDCTNSCLFNVLTDPCEAFDVSKQYPTVVKELIKTVRNYRKVLLAQPKRGVDPRSLPDYEGGPWLPWLTVDGEPLPRPLSTNSSHHLNRTEIVGSAKTGMVSALDESVGRVVRALHKKGMLDNSIVVFMSDNGALTDGTLSNSGSNYPYRGHKFSRYEGGVHVPAFIWSPMIKNASRVHEGYFHVTDWLPTLYKLAGGNINELGSIDGINQEDSIVNGSPSPRDSILLNIDELGLQNGAIKGRFKYLTGVSSRRASYKGENADDRDLSAPPYNVRAVTKSMAAMAIANTRNELIVSKNKILKLRRESKVVCAPHSRQRIDCKKICLFDVLADPCETSNLSARYPQVVDELAGIVENYRKVLMPQEKIQIDGRSLPDYKGGPWLPWLFLDGQPFPRHGRPMVSII